MAGVLSVGERYTDGYKARVRGEILRGPTPDLNTSARVPDLKLASGGGWLMSAEEFDLRTTPKRIRLSPFLAGCKIF